MKPATSELAAYREEIAAVVAKETGKLNSFSRALRDLRDLQQHGQLDRILIDRALESTEHARIQLTELVDLVKRENESHAFNELIKYAGYAFRLSVAARTLFLRHTPTLSGAPHSLDPGQHHRLNRGDHMIDYARNAYLQFQDSVSGSEKTIADHPVLGEMAESIAATLYGGSGERRQVLFSSAMAAIDSLIDLAVLIAREAGSSNLIGQRSWFEIRQYAQEHYPGEFNLVDEQDTGSILDAIRDPAITSIIIEPIANFPEMTVIDLEKVVAALKSTRFDRPKIILFDNVHTPELDILGSYFQGEMPENLCVGVVVSGVKFLQAGWDISKSGLLVLRYDEAAFGYLNQTIYEKLIDIRSIAGRAPTVEEAFLADIETPESLRSRLERYDRNTAFFAQSLDRWLREKDLGHVSSPWLKDHPGHQTAMSTYGTGGRILFIFFNSGRVPETELGELFRDLAEAAEEKGVSLMAAPSFGMASPHIHIVIRPGFPTSIRVSTGSTNRETVERLLEVFHAHLGKYCD